MIGRTNINGTNDASGVGAVLSIDAPTGSTVTVSQGSFSKVLRDSIQINTYVSRYFYLVKPSRFGSWTAIATDGEDTVSDTILITANKAYEVDLSESLDRLAADLAATGWSALSRNSGDRFVTNPEARTYTRTTNDPVIGISSRASSQYWACGAVSLLSTLPGTYNQYGQMQSFSACTTPGGTTYYVFRQPNGFTAAQASLSLIFGGTTYPLPTNTSIPYVNNNGYIACDDSTALAELNNFIDRLAALV